MTVWAERTREDAHLLNPAYLALVTRRLVDGYTSERDNGLPVPLVFAGVPAALYSPVRRGLPRTVRTSLYVWIEEHRDLQIALADRAAHLVAEVRQGLLYALAGGLVQVQPGGELGAGVAGQESRRVREISTSDMSETLQRSEWIGRWFARAGDAGTILLAWGLAP